MATATPAPTIEEHLFADDGRVPNNPRLPLIVYHGALATGPGAAAACEALFAANGWSGGWRAGIYGYHHYHSTAHEALGVVAGSARVRLGGEGGAVVEVRAGDVVVIPAGVAHKSEAASPDLLVVGAYPGGHGPDMRAPDMRAPDMRAPDMRAPGGPERERALANIAAVPLPAADPVYGKSGPLIKRWGAAAQTGADRRAEGYRQLPE